MDRRAAVRAYKETPRPMGLFRIRNLRTGKSLVGRSVDLPARLNRERAQLRLGAHPNRLLQQDWAALGPDAFAFEVLDTLEPKDDRSRADTEAELEALEAMWRDRLAAEGEVERYDPPRAAVRR